MTCFSCLAAEHAPRADDFTAGCDSCKARALAVTGAHEESERAGKLTAQYIGALKALFGDAWRAGNEAVKAWAAKAKPNAMEHAVAQMPIASPTKKRKR